MAIARLADVLIFCFRCHADGPAYFFRSAGTTRDAVRVKWSYKNRPVQLVDTAGITRLAYWDSSALIDSVAVAAATKARVGEGW